MLNTAEIYQSRVYEPSEKELLSQWLNTEHECPGDFRMFAKDNEENIVIPACWECYKANRTLYDAQLNPDLRLVKSAFSKIKSIAA